MQWMATLIIVSALTPAAQIEVRLTEGPTRKAELLSLTHEQMTVSFDDNNTRETIPANQVQQLRWIQQSPSPPGDISKANPLQVVLIDGSSIRAKSFLASSGKVSAEWQGPQPLELNVEQLRAVRMGTFPESVDRNWQEFLQKPIVADSVSVLRKQNDVDHVQGLLRDVTADVVKFEFDGDTIDVRRNKVVGISYYRPRTTPLPAARGELTLSDGSQLKIDELTSEDGDLRVRTVAGVTVRIPSALLDRLDLASQSLTYLSSLEPESSQWTPLVRVAGLEGAMNRWYEPRKDQRLNGDPLELRVDGREQPFAKGLSLHSRSQLVYRIAGEYRRFACLAGIDPALGVGNVQLTILADGEVRYQETLKANANATPIDVNLLGANRLTILVDYGDRSDVADHLILGDARLIK